MQNLIKFIAVAMLISLQLEQSNVSERTLGISFNISINST